MASLPPPWLVRTVESLLRWRTVWAVLAVAFTIVCLRPASQLAFDQSIESLYSNDDPRLNAWMESKKLFGGDEFVVVAYSDPDLFADEHELTEQARARIDAIAEQLRQVPGIDSDSVQDLATALLAPIGREKIRRLLEGLLVGRDGKATAVFARLKAERDSEISRAETYRRIRAFADKHEPPAFVIGEPVQVHDMFRYVEEDGSTLGIATTVLMMIIILILFRSLRWMLLPLAVVQVTLIWTKAIMVMSGMQLSMVSSILNSLVTVIGIATVMHVTIRYREHREKLEPLEALRQTLLDLSLPVFWTIATTATGFAAVLTSNIGPVNSFGIMMTLATVLVTFAIAMLLPAGILLGSKTDRPATAPAEIELTGMLDRVTSCVEHSPVTVGAIMFAITAFCSAGLLWLKVETDFSKNFRRNSPIVKSLDFFETNLGGGGTWEINFPAPNELDESYLEKVQSLSDDLHKLESPEGKPGHLTKVVAVTDSLALLPRLFPLSWRLSALDRMQPEFVSSLYNPSEGRMRIMLRGLERQPSESKLRLIAEVETVARKHFPEAKTTGLFVMLAFLIESLMSDQLSSFLYSAAAIVLLMAIAYRSLTMGFIMLIPNLFPLVLVIGTMGWIGLPINIATAMIASVSLGLTVDSGILFMAGYREARDRGLSFSESLHETNRGVGMAIIFSNVALIVGFAVLTLSHFIPLVYFGILVGIAMVGGMLGNLILMPLLLRIVDRN